MLLNFKREVILNVKGQHFSGQSYSRPYINVIPVMMKKVFPIRDTL